MALNTRLNLLLSRCFFFSFNSEKNIRLQKNAVITMISEFTLKALTFFLLVLALLHLQTFSCYTNIVYGVCLLLSSFYVLCLV